MSNVRPDMKVRLTQVNGAFHFRGFGPGGQSVDTDSPDDGSTPKGVSPLQLIPIALGSCSAVDVVSILKKGRQPLEALEIEVSAERDGGKPISMITAIHIHFMATGALDPDKVERAVRLAVSRYCTVAALIKATVHISASFSVGADRYDVLDVMNG